MATSLKQLTFRRGILTETQLTHQQGNFTVAKLTRRHGNLTERQFLQDPVQVQYLNYKAI